jgi:hypothetical protein
VEGYRKFEAFIEMAAKRAADHNVALDAERIRLLVPLIRSLSEERIRANPMSVQPLRTSPDMRQW